MTNKLDVIINSLKVLDLRKFYCMKWNFLYQITAASRLGGYRPQIPVLSVLCPQLNLLNLPLPPEQNSWVRHWLQMVQVLKSFLERWMDSKNRDSTPFDLNKTRCDSQWLRCMYWNAHVTTGLAPQHRYMDLTKTNNLHAPESFLRKCQVCS